MKVVVSGYIGKKVTGIGRSLICMLDNSRREDIEYVVYTNEDIQNEFKFSNPRVTVKTYSVSRMSSMKNLLWTTFVFPFVVKIEKADKALIPNFTLLLLKFCPTVVIMHDLIEFNVPDKFSKLKMFYRTKLADPITARRANRILTDSNNSKQDIIHYLKVPDNKISIVYDGVDCNHFNPMPKRQAAAILQKKKWPECFLLYVGTIDHPGKNVMGLVQAYERLKKEGTYSGKLVLAGMPGSGYEQVEQYISQSEYKDSIILTGYVTDEELSALYSSCDVFCFLSLYEGFGIPPLEAMACGAKVVVSNTSSLPEVVGNAGWQVTPHSVPEIADIINKALQQEKDSNYQKRVKDQLEKFDWRVQAEHFEKEFE